MVKQTEMVEFEDQGSGIETRTPVIVGRRPLEIAHELKRVIFVAKTGDDANDGRWYGNPKLTFASAMSAAGPRAHGELNVDEIPANNQIVLDTSEGDVTAAFEADEEFRISKSASGNDGVYTVASSNWDGTNTTITTNETTLTTVTSPAAEALPTRKMEIFCEDGGVYVEDLVGEPYVDIEAPSAALIPATSAASGGAQIKDSETWTFGQITRIHTGVRMITNGKAKVVVDQGGTETGAVNGQFLFLVDSRPSGTSPFGVDTDGGTLDVEMRRYEGEANIGGVYANREDANLSLEVGSIQVDDGGTATWWDFFAEGVSTTSKNAIMNLDVGFYNRDIAGQGCFRAFGSQPGSLGEVNVVGGRIVTAGTAFETSGAQADKRVQALCNVVDAVTLVIADNNGEINIRVNRITGIAFRLGTLATVSIITRDEIGTETMKVTRDTPSTSDTTGALTVEGGIGCRGNVNMQASGKGIHTANQLIAKSSSADGSGKVRSERESGGFAGYIESKHSSGRHGWDFDGKVSCGEDANGFVVGLSDNLSNARFRIDSSGRLVFWEPGSAQLLTVKAIGDFEVLRRNGSDVEGVNREVLQTHRLRPSDLEDTNDADWGAMVTTPAVGADTNNASLQVISLDGTVEEGFGFRAFVPSGATKLTIRFRSRAETAPGGAAAVVPRLYFRGIPDDATIPSWSSPTLLTALDFPTSELWQYDEQELDLATLGITANQETQFQVTRAVDDGGDTLTGDWTLLVTELLFK